MQHDRRVLADRIKHHRVAALGGNFADDVDAFGFKPLQVDRRSDMVVEVSRIRAQRPEIAGPKLDRR
jgi:hypothetical protein